MTVQIYLAKLDFCASYITLKAGRCIACSVLMVALILLLRRTVLKDSTFGRGIIWCLLIPALFVGKLRFFYESRMGVRLFFWWHNISLGIPWVRVVYMTGLLVSGIFSCTAAGSSGALPVASEGASSPETGCCSATYRFRPLLRDCSGRVS